MELAPFVTLWPAQRILRLPCTELAEVFSRFRDDVGEEFHLDAAEGLAWYR